MSICKDCAKYNSCTSPWHKLSEVEIKNICCNFKDKLDLVEVVRCKDCVHRVESDTEGYCICCAMTNPNYVPLNHFCNYGEKRAD